MNIFDIMGPVMVGPSSSHTAGAVKIGYISRRLLGESVTSAKILLYGSFLTTGKGHGTRKALVAGLLGMKPDDIRIPNALDLANEQGIELQWGEAVLCPSKYSTVDIDRSVGQNTGSHRSVTWGFTYKYSGDRWNRDKFFGRSAHTGCPQPRSAGACVRGYLDASPQRCKYCHNAVISREPRR